MNEDEEEADEEEEASQATQQPASEADLGPSIEEVDAAIRLVSEDLTHHTYLASIQLAWSQAQNWSMGIVMHVLASCLWRCHMGLGRLSWAQIV